MAFERIRELIAEIDLLLKAAEKVPDLERRVAELEAQLTGQQKNGNQAAPLKITADPDTWPKRQRKSTSDIPLAGHKEYDTDRDDLAIALTVLQRAPRDWGTLRHEIAMTRRLTSQQVAELKARITRNKLLAA